VTDQPPPADRTPPQAPWPASPPPPPADRTPPQAPWPASPPPPTADPWSGPPTIIEFGAPSHAPAPGDAALDPAAGPRRRAPIVISIAAVVALLLGGAAFAGLRMWNGSGPQPEEAVPASIAAFARVDLRPGLGQGLKLNDLLDKFPKGKNGEDAAQALKRGLFETVEIEEADYRKHIEPWFADRFGIGVWLDTNKRPHVIAAVASDDDGAATDGLAALQRDRRAERWGFVVDDGWALIVTGADAQEVARDAAADANTASLANASAFRDALATLPARQPVVGWVDLDRAGEAYAQAVRALMQGPDGEAPDEIGLNPFTGALGDAERMTGRLILGAQATGNGFEIRLRGVGMSQPARTGPAGDVLSRLGEQPGNSTVAAVASFPAFDEKTFGALGFLIGGGPQLDQLPPEVAAELAKDPEFAQARAQMEAMTRALRALSGATLGLAVTDMASPALHATADVAEGALAKDLADALGRFGESGPDLKVSRNGNRVELKTAGFDPEGTLSATAVYRETMADMPDDGVAAIYVDIQRLARQGGASEQERRDIAPVKSVGLVAGYDGGDTVAMLRVVIR
jgi:hypothetical protein